MISSKKDNFLKSESKIYNLHNCETYQTLFQSRKFLRYSITQYYIDSGFATKEEITFEVPIQRRSIKSTFMREAN